MTAPEQTPGQLDLPVDEAQADREANITEDEATHDEEALRGVDLT